MDQEQSQGKRLLEVMARIRRVSTKHHLEDIIQQREFFILGIIHRHMKLNQVDGQGHTGQPGIKISELSELLQIKTPSVSQMINTFEEKGYVKRVTTPNDRRVVYITLADEGKAVLEKANQAFVTMTDEIVSKLGHEETEQLISLCNRLYEIIGDIRDRQAQG